MRPIKFRTWNGEEMIYASNSLIFGTYYDATTDQPLMQMTGLKDKNGKEIYEGDIVGFEELRDAQEWQSYSGGIPRIEWRDRYGAFRICNGVENENGVAMYEFDSKEVIGNIMENPELLK